MSGFTLPTMRPTRPRGARVLHHDLAHLDGKVPDSNQVFFGFRRQSDHVVQLQVLDAVGEDQFGRRQDLVVGHRLVDHPTQPVRTGLGRDGDRPFTTPAQQLDDRLGQIVEPERRRADRVAHVEQACQNPLDLRMVAKGNGHEPGLGGVRRGRPCAARGCDRRRTPAQAGSCSPPSRIGTGSRSHARPRSGSASRIPCRG